VVGDSGDHVLVAVAVDVGHRQAVGAARPTMPDPFESSRRWLAAVVLEPGDPPIEVADSQLFAKAGH
jgi:hypothetical protein